MRKWQLSLRGLWPPKRTEKECNDHRTEGDERRIPSQPLLRQAFHDQGDPNCEAIDEYTIRMAVLCGCALHPVAFKEFYRNKCKTGISPRLDRDSCEIHMTDGMAGETIIHWLIATGSCSLPTKEKKTGVISSPLANNNRVKGALPMIAFTAIGLRPKIRAFGAITQTV